MEYAEGDERYYGWSTYIPTGLPQPPSGHVWHFLLQLKTAGACGQPYLAVGLDRHNSDFHLALWGISQYPQVEATKLWLAPAAVERGRWHNFILGVKWSSDPSVGWVKFWVDGQLFHSTVKRTLFNYGGCRLDDGKTGVMPAHLKFGTYRGFDMGSVTTFNHHGLKVGLHVEDVDPRGLWEEFEHGAPVDWEKDGLWRVLSGGNLCGNPISGKSMAFSALAFNWGPPFSTYCTFSIDGVKSGVLRTKPFKTNSGGGFVEFKHLSDTEQHVGYDVRTVRVVSPSVNNGVPTVLKQFCGPKATGPRPQFPVYCEDSKNGAGSWILEFLSIPSQYGGKNDVRLEFEFDTVDDELNDGRGWIIDDVRLSTHYPL
jgi:hypothetical protein